MSPTIKRRLFRVLAAVFTIVVIVSLARTFRAEGPAAWEAWQKSTIDWKWFALACVIGFTGHSVSILGWRKVLFDMGIRLSLRENIRMFFVGNLGRYLPGGKVWQMGIVSSMAAERGFPPAQLAASSLLQGIVGVVMGLLLLFLLGGTLLRRSPWWFVLPALGVSALLALPAMIRRSPRLQSLLEDKLEGMERTTVLSMATLVLAATMQWCLWGVALFALAHSIIGDQAESVVTYIVAWIGSLLAGLLAVVTPAGLGVRDAAMQVILSRAGLGIGSALVVVVIARVWSTLMEVVPALLMLLVSRARQRGQRPQRASLAESRQAT